MFGFGKALDVLRDGDAVRRQGWPGIVLLLANEHHEQFPGVQIEVNALRAHVDSDLVTFPETLTTVSRAGVVNYWSPTHADLLAEDWDYAR